ncbi:MAG: hypothetical protein U5R06_09560 [candidate division KSB1 bacterium]|nr:hypothetical protein [candidate division KSB1 bacterium]
MRVGFDAGRALRVRILICTAWPKRQAETKNWPLDCADALSELESDALPKRMTKRQGQALQL